MADVSMDYSEYSEDDYEDDASESEFDENSPAVKSKVRAMARETGERTDFLLAKAKVRPNISYSVHWCYAAAFSSQFPNNISSEQVIETDKNIITASGAAAAFDLALL